MTADELPFAEIASKAVAWLASTPIDGSDVPYVMNDAQAAIMEFLERAWCVIDLCDSHSFIGFYTYGCNVSTSLPSPSHVGVICLYCMFRSLWLVVPSCVSLRVRVPLPYI